MTDARPAATLSGGVALLERAVGYALGQLHAVIVADLSRRTPCPDWDLRQLLGHLDDSLTALQEALDLARVDPGPGCGPAEPGAGRDAAPRPGPDPAGLGYGPAGLGYGPADSAKALVGALRGRASRLLGALAGAADDGLVWVGGFPVPAGIVISAGAIDVAVHGWDVARACGQAQPIPEQLAEDLLQISPLLVTPAERPALFGAPVPVSREACASDRLVAYLGRDPATS